MGAFVFWKPRYLHGCNLEAQSLRMLALEAKVVLQTDSDFRVGGFCFCFWGRNDSLQMHALSQTSLLHFPWCYDCCSPMLTLDPVYQSPARHDPEH